MLTVPQHIFLTRPAANFTDKITQLEAENSRLVIELNKCKNTAAIELTKKQEAEEVAKHVKMTSHRLDLENQSLKKDNQKLLRLAEDLRAKSAKSFLIVDEASLILDKLRSSLPSIHKQQN